MIPLKDQVFADGCAAYNDGEPRLAHSACWRYENATEMCAEWIAGWDFGRYLELSPDET